MSLKDKIAVITGVANPQGIGYSTAKLFAREGATQIIVDGSEQVHSRANELIKAGYKVRSFQIDLVDSKKVNNIAKTILDENSKIDILVNVAGLRGIFGEEHRASYKGFEDIPEKEYDFIVNVNLKTTFNCIKAFLPSMIKQKYGKIVNVASVTGPQVCGPAPSGYTSGKAGICGLTKALALEVAAYGITVNAINPGWIYTAISSYGQPGTPNYTAYAKSIPMKRFGRGEDCADLILFLATDASSYLTGLEVIIDGGNIIQEMKAGLSYPEM